MFRSISFKRQCLFALYGAKVLYAKIYNHLNKVIKKSPLNLSVSLEISQVRWFHLQSVA